MFYTEFVRYMLCTSSFTCPLPMVNGIKWKTKYSYQATVAFYITQKKLEKNFTMELFIYIISRISFKTVIYCSAKLHLLIQTILQSFQIANWTPEYYNNISQLPVDMPADLKIKISEYYGIYRNLVRKQSKILVTHVYVYKYTLR
jgi:hypothetical protein